MVPAGSLTHTVFFIDRSLGSRVIVDAFRASSIPVEAHDEHFPDDAPDEEWIKKAGNNGWVAITRDKGILYRYYIIETIFKYQARLIVIRNKNFNGTEGAPFLVNKAPLISAFAQRTPSPFVAGLRADGTITKYDIEHRRADADQDCFA